jgi:hypothetical protein
MISRDLYKMNISFKPNPVSMLSGGSQLYYFRNNMLFIFFFFINSMLMYRFKIKLLSLRQTATTFQPIPTQMFAPFCIKGDGHHCNDRQAPIKPGFHTASQSLPNRMEKLWDSQLNNKCYTLSEGR